MATRAIRPRKLHVTVSCAALVGSVGLISDDARADCHFVLAAPPFFLCDGTNTTPQSVITNSTADVRTASGFSVDATAAGGDALHIQSDGPIKYIDTFASPLTGPDVALRIQNTGDSPLGPGSIAVETSGAITGGTGILAQNNGSGSIDVSATGPILATTGSGIRAINGAAGENLSILAGDVTATTTVGGNLGITVQNAGTGFTRVESTGTASSGVTGIIAMNTASGTDLSVIANNASGNISGIAVFGHGTGETRVTTTGTISGTSLNGIYAYVSAGGGTGLTVISAGAHGGTTGIETENGGSGATRIVASGPVTGGTGMGIYATNLGTATDLTVESVDVSGDLYGIFAQNAGSGSTRVTSTGNVMSSGMGSEGIAVNSQANGIGIDAFNTQGVTNGIRSLNQGTGDTVIAVTGEAIGVAGNGIVAFNGANAAGISITATSAHGGHYGIQAANNGTGATSITTNGLVEGGDAAIFASSAGQPIAINTNGLVRNLSQLSNDLAIEASGGPVTLTNTGGMIGTVKFDAGAHVMTNNATWNTAGGSNDFGGGTLTNSAGMTIVGAANGAAAETTTLNGLASFINHGVLGMVDGGAGDVTRQTGGDARFEAGSSLAIDINAAGQADRFVTTGTAMLAGATLTVNAAGGIAYGTRYTVLTADGGLSGQFAALTGVTSTAFLTVEDVYDANNAYLDVLRYRLFADAGLTPNQIATGRGLDSIPAGGELFNAVAALTTDEQARAAFDRLSGEMHASAKTALIEDSRLVREAANDRLRQSFAAVGAPVMPVMSYAPAGRVALPAETAMAYAMATKAPASSQTAIWGRAFGSWGHTGSDGNAARLSRSTGGLVSGFDGVIADTWRAGLLGGYSSTTFRAPDRASSGHSDNYHIGLYGGTQWGPLGFRAGAAYTWHDISVSRSVAFSGFADQLKADYSAGTAQAFGELGYRIDTAPVSFEPFANLAYVSLHADGFSERGGAAALASFGARTDVAFTTLGVRASADFTLGGALATARGTLGWRHAFGDTTPLASFAFAGGNAFTIAGVPIARNAAVVDAGIDLAIAPGATIGVSYNGQFGGSATDQSVRGNLMVRF